MKQVDENKLLTDVLKGVSRSFYLSLRILPAPMRTAAGLGYLLARASDTIADTSSVASSRRLSWLEDYANAFRSGSGWHADAELLEKCEQRERVLLEKIDSIFSHAGDLPQKQRQLVVGVIDTIISGQALDLQRSGEGKAMSLRTDAELWDYCDRVAGCVGDFWTRLGYETMGEQFSSASMSLMCAAGRSLGKGLQLVNILRDIPADLSMGRFYLPGMDEMAEDARRDLYLQWIGRAKSCVEDGFLYAEQIVNRRARAASVLPALLAEDTLHLLEKAEWRQLSNRVKVSRAHVLRTVVEAFCF